MSDVDQKQGRLKTSAESAAVRIAVWRARRSTSVGGILFAVLGWVVCAAVLACLLAVFVHQGRRLAESQARVEPALAEIRASFERRRADLVQSRHVRAETIANLIKREEDLTLQIKGLELSIAELEPRVKTLARTEAARREELDDRARTDHGMLENVDALQQSIDELQSVRDQLNDLYKARFLTMEAVYSRARADPDPERLRDFYESHQHTVFAPAAAYYAAEKMLAAGRAQDAVRLYKELSRHYSNSVYAREAKGRLAQVEEGEAYEEPSEPITFEPYLPHLVEQ